MTLWLCDPVAAVILDFVGRVKISALKSEGKIILHLEGKKIITQLSILSRESQNIHLLIRGNNGDRAVCVPGIDNYSVAWVNPIECMSLADEQMVLKLLFRPEGSTSHGVWNSLHGSKLRASSLPAAKAESWIDRAYQDDDRVILIGCQRHLDFIFDPTFPCIFHCLLFTVESLSSVSKGKDYLSIWDGKCYVLSVCNSTCASCGQQRPGLFLPQRKGKVRACP